MGICASTKAIQSPAHEHAPETEYKPYIFDTTIVPPQPPVR